MVLFNKDNFEQKLQNTEKTIIVDFYAEWCGPCKMLDPVLLEVEDENSDEVIIGKVNVDEEMELAYQYSVANIPTVIAFDNGKEKARLTGLTSKKAIIELIK